MPKFLVTNGSYYEPFTYNELAAPIMQAVEAHNAAQDAYDTLSSETAALKNYITDNPGDVKAKQMYDDYTSKLENLQNNLWTNGYNASTRRDLAVARAGYFGDMTRLANAVKTRQERSALWSKMKLEHPELVTSDNPGNAGLDAYLDNENYGLDFYTYSGEKFKEEVGAEVLARGNELLRNPEIMNYPELAGKLAVKLREGFTNQEVSRAQQYVRALLASADGSVPKSEIIAAALKRANANDHSNNLTTEENLLVGALLSRLSATGAADRVNDQELGKLVGYGELGMRVGGVRDTKTEWQNDLQWDYDRKVDLENLRHRHSMEEAAAKAANSSSGKKGKNGSDEEWTEATNTGEFIPTESSIYNDWIRSTRRESKAYENGQTITISDPWGRNSMTAHNEYEMADYLYGTQDRERVRAAYGGYDVAFKPDGKEYEVRLKNGETRTVKISKMDVTDANRLNLNPETAVAVTTKSGKLNEEASRQVSNARSQYLEHVAAITEKNPDAAKHAVKPSDQKKMREQYGFPATAPWKDFYGFMLTKAEKGDQPAVVIANDSSHDYSKKNLARAIIRQYNSITSSTNADGKHGKQSRAAFYEVGEGGRPKREGITDIAQIFGTRGSGGTRELRDDTLTNISATLQDLAQDRPMVRIQTSVNPGKVFMVDADLLGPLFSNNYTSVISETGRSTSDMIDYLLTPVLHPESVYGMSPKAAEEWSYDAAALLGGEFPAVRRQNGAVTPASPREIMLNKSFQDLLKRSVMRHIANPSAEKIRQEIGQNHEQSIGDQSSTAQSIL